MLATFVNECLTASFTDSGLALQDIINEVGRRLGFRVVNGAYQGRPGSVGHDGLWTLPTNHSLVVEVKTTDAYRIDTSKIAGYRKQLAGQGLLKEDSSSILMIVGRKDTDDLESQIRGSRFAWDIRLISADALLRLMKLKETLDDPTTINRICEILIPKEYTRLDEIIELVFSATEEVKQDEDLEEPTSPEQAQSSDDSEKPVALGCGSPERVLSIAYSKLKPLLSDLWTSERDNGTRYWHIRLHRQGEKIYLERKKEKGKVEFSQYLL